MYYGRQRGIQHGGYPVHGCYAIVWIHCVPVHDPYPVRVPRDAILPTDPALGV